MKPYICIKRFIPKTYDIDAGNHVSNIVYIRWLEDLRLLWLETYYPFRKLSDAGLFPVMRRTEIDYIHAIRLGNEVTASIELASLGKARFTFYFEFRVDEKTVARAKQDGAWINKNTGRPVRTPVEMMEMYKDTQVFKE
ncbi:acyl-CoA thioesterase [bacterium]|nr:acyl-CoA thioesterase [bacterium]